MLILKHRRGVLGGVLLVLVMRSKASLSLKCSAQVQDAHRNPVSPRMQDWPVSRNPQTAHPCAEGDTYGRTMQWHQRLKASVDCRWGRSCLEGVQQVEKGHPWCLAGCSIVRVHNVLVA